MAKKTNRSAYNKAAVEKEMNSIQTIVNWYLKSKELTVVSEKLEGLAVHLPEKQI